MNAQRQQQGAAGAAPVLALLLSLWGQQAAGASMNVNPVRLELAGAGQSTELRIRNDDLKAISVEVTAWEWTQSPQGEDRLDATGELLAVPPIFTIEPGRQQIVRIAFLGTPEPGQERTFRLLATELAPPSGPQGASISMRVQLSLPVFVTDPGGELRPDLKLVGVRRAEQGTLVTLRNEGTAHVKLRSVELIGADGTLPGPGSKPAGQARYLLPGTTLDVLIPGDAGTPERVRITPEKGEGWEHEVGPAE